MNVSQLCIPKEIISLHHQDHAHGIQPTPHPNTPFRCQEADSQHEQYPRSCSPQRPIKHPFSKQRNLQTMRVHNYSHIHRGRCYRNPVLPRASGRVTEHQNPAFISRTQNLKPQETLYSAALFHSLRRRRFVMCVWDFCLVRFDIGLIPFLYLLTRKKLRHR